MADANVRAGRRIRPKPVGLASVTLIACLLGVFAAPSLAGPAKPKTRRVSLSSARVQGNDDSSHPAITPDHRLVAFQSYASNLVPHDTNGQGDIFLRNLKTGKTKRVSVSSSGVQADRSSYWPSLSADGRFVAFYSDATNLVPGDTNSAYDVFVHDRKTGKTKRVSVSSSGIEGDSDSEYPSISADGRLVAFHSHASNLVAGDTNSAYDVFVHDRKTGKTKRVSVSSGGAPGNGDTRDGSLSADGRLVVFWSAATNLVGGDTNAKSDIFVHNLRSGKTKRVSVRSSGAQGDGDSNGFPGLSATGRFVVFASGAANLVPGDTNGYTDVFVHDRKSGKTKLVSVSSSGAQANGYSYLIDPPVISANGRWVVFISQATNLGGGAITTEQDFIRDRKTHKTRPLSVSTGGNIANSYSFDPTITPDGRFVAFPSRGTNLVGGDTNGFGDIFVRGPLH